MVVCSPIVVLLNVSGRPGRDVVGAIMAGLEASVTGGNCDRAGEEGGGMSSPFSAIVDQAMAWWCWRYGSKRQAAEDT
jgi:hypothetical protein